MLPRIGAKLIVQDAEIRCYRLTVVWSTITRYYGVVFSGQNESSATCRLLISETSRAIDFRNPMAISFRDPSSSTPS